MRVHSNSDVVAVGEGIEVALNEIWNGKKRIGEVGTWNRLVEEKVMGTDVPTSTRDFECCGVLKKIVDDDSVEAAERICEANIH